MRQLLGAYENKLGVSRGILATYATTPLSVARLPKLDVAGSSPVARSSEVIWLE